MIYVKVELWPFGDRTKAKPLGEMYIANDATGSLTRGNYKAILKNSVGRTFRACKVADFPRKRLNVYDLMFRVLRTAVGDRNEPKTKKSKRELTKGEG